MQSNWLITIAAVSLLLLTAVGAQNAKVSPKLDFDESDANNNNSTNVPVIPGTKNESRSDNDDGANQGGNDNNSRPKIHGVRVTVDTGDNHKTKESKESVEISTDGGKHKKRVGIHTDITFEISGIDDDNNNNGTNSPSQRSDDDKEDASVPIFKGRGPTQKPRKPHDPKYNWHQPNFSAERRSYDTIPPRSGHGYSNYYPQYPTYNVPIYTGSRTDGRDHRRHDNDGWVNYVPSHTYWTTERNYNEHYRPNTAASTGSIGGGGGGIWKPCYCANSDRTRRESPPESKHPAQSPPQSNSNANTKRQSVDDKLESPFSL